MLERLKPYVIGLLTYTPLARRFSIPETGGSSDPRYCYGVFMRHLVHASRAGLDRFPEVVAELGPGDSIGSGLAWLIAGSRRYVALDVRRYTDLRRNLTIFDALVEQFRERAPAPGPDEFPEMKPALDPLSFPRELLDETRLAAALAPARLVELRRELEAGGGDAIEYVAPWDREENIERGTVDLVFSQAVMEHVEDIDRVHARCADWLRPGGMVSHQIDFRSHGTSPTWDGYRAYAEWQWRIVRGRRAYLINRAPDCDHLAALARHGFVLRTRIPATLRPTVPPDRYAARFRRLDEASRGTAGLFVQAVLDRGQSMTHDPGSLGSHSGTSA